MNIAATTRPSFKQRIVSGEFVCGIFACIPTFQTIEILSHTNIDYLAIEAEHAATNIPILHQQIVAAGGRKPILVRISSEHVDTLKPLLDLGVDAIMVPNVHTAEQARHIVSLTRFGPEGRRGIGGSVRAAMWGLDKNYYRSGPSPIAVTVQIESREALENLKDICSVEGVDAVFFGPNDLAAQLGFPGQPNAPEVRKALEDGMQLARQCGVMTGCLAAAADIAHWRKFGGTFFISGADIGVLMQGTNAIAATVAQGA
ncbi:MULTISPECIES: aldolase/citrate lyase family protein [unclassified Beijerinckia]|uniref:HpcH/HpaI aldolase family protein n=1 Tax=unclassified Beijerinckia TaxID=2638183 RepID=UPI000894AB37|nr:MULTISPECIES: aldolase/citrate lyase family protein [unclassified Beijerinckia]MDH7795301.1 4-hydroxy-2-oxoheptanedioate aldolase [Beijerinckia sp. GAS462]SEB95892.1 2-dehydro-3-deoxyglucarate aldolase/4-hydroxy-2-oxoheptanedioate aldolase [Beijerinckia sp. 28-YEA-48]